MSESVRPRIGIIGTGAIGGYYGLMLARAGFEVHFLLRSEYEAVARDGLRVRHAQLGELHLPQVNAWRDAAQMPRCDWLLVGAKTTSNAELAPLIVQAAAPGAKVVLLQNGLGVEDALRPLLPDALHLFGGLCFICAHREAPGVVVHQAQGVCNLGYHSGPASAAERQVLLEQGVAWLREAGIESAVIADLDQARWQKLVWNIPYNGVSVLLGSSTAPLMASPHSRALLQSLMEEVVDAARACGHRLPDHYPQKLLAYTDRMPDYLPSMYHDFAQRRPAELPALYAAPLAAAVAAGVDMPRVRMLHQTLAFLQEAGQ
jgi:2-dehydropantoate 2-reductase